MNWESLLSLKISFWLRELPASVSLMMASESEWQKNQGRLRLCVEIR